MDTLPLVAPEQVGLSAARLDRVRKWMHGWVDSGKLAGMVTCVLRKGERADSKRAIAQAAWTPDCSLRTMMYLKSGFCCKACPMPATFP